VKMIRFERTFDVYSRGLELVREIQQMWEKNDALPRRTWEQTTRANDIIEQRIRSLMHKFDLTIEEWHYWARIAAGV